MWITLLAILSNRAGSQNQGAVQGIAGKSGASASILGLLTGGKIVICYGVDLCTRMIWPLSWHCET